MSKLKGHTARIIPTDAPAAWRNGGSTRTRRARTLDFAALLRLGQTHTASLASHQEDKKHTAFLPPDDRNPPSPSSSSSRPLTLSDPLFAHICVAIAPVIQALSRHQQRLIELATLIAHEAAVFASNRSIYQAGVWELQLPLDPKLFPDAILHLTLSPTSLALRFDVNDNATRALLLRHASLLESTLRDLLAGWREPRHLELTFW